LRSRTTDLNVIGLRGFYGLELLNPGRNLKFIELILGYSRFDAFALEIHVGVL
jgi:hypothetical protein